MSAFFYYKKRLLSIFAVAFCGLIIAISCVYAGLLSYRQEVVVQKSFYFLIAESEHVQVGTEIAQLDGGAGYPLLVGNDYKVAYAVYFDKEQGERAEKQLCQKGTNAQLTTCFVQSLVFTGKREQACMASVCSAMDNLYACIDILQQEIERLSRGATQQSSKSILEILKTQFNAFANAYQSVYTAFAQICKESADLISNSLNGIVYNKDLRYLLCFLCDSYVHLSQDFAI